MTHEKAILATENYIKDMEKLADECKKSLADCSDDLKPYYKSDLIDIERSIVSSKKYLEYLKRCMAK